MTACFACEGFPSAALSPCGLCGAKAYEDTDMSVKRAHMKNNLESLRRTKNLTLAELGSMCGISKSHVHQLEKQGANVSLRTAYMFAKVLGVEVTDIWPNEIEVVEETVTTRRVIWQSLPAHLKKHTR